MTTTKAFHRIRNTRGASFLTRGSDDYDHNGLNKARRSLDKALAAEQLSDAAYEDEDVQAELLQAANTNIQYRVVVVTQMYENYGAHCCNCPEGEPCECPQYWKAKGGNEYHVMVGGIADVIAMGTAGLQRIAGRLADKVERHDNYFHEYRIDWYVCGTDEETYDERMTREMVEEGYMSHEQMEAWKKNHIVELEV